MRCSCEIRQLSSVAKFNLFSFNIWPAPVYLFQEQTFKMYLDDLSNQAQLNMTCLFVSPFCKCGIWENLILGLFFYISALFSIYFLFQNWKKLKSKKKCKMVFDQTILFWIALIIYQIFRGTISICYFPYSAKTVGLVFIGFHHILLFIPMCFVILILFDLLFTYQNPGTNAITFFRSLFILFFLTFVALGIALSCIDWNSEGRIDPEESLSFWVACTDLILFLFFIFPAINLLKDVMYPMVQPEDRNCVRFCQFGIGLNIFIFLFRMMFNFLHYIKLNPIQDWIVRENDECAVPRDDFFIPSVGVRIWNFFYYLLCDLGPVVLAMIAVNLFKKHDMMFNENPYFTKQSD